MMENGLYQFNLEHYKYTYNMKNGFKLSRERSNEDDDDELRALTMEQMIRPFYLTFGLLAISVLVFVGEIIYFKWMALRDRSKYSIEFVIIANWEKTLAAISFIFRKCPTDFIVNK